MAIQKLMKDLIILPQEMQEILAPVFNNDIRKCRFMVTIKFVAQANMLQCREVLSEKQVETNSQALKIIDVVLREL